MRGLIIRSPHIDNILAGRKTWEMRSTAINLRGTIALIKAGSGSVVGIADVLGSVGPLTIEERLATEHRHCVSASTWQDIQFQKYEYAWVLGNVTPLANPVPYRHPKGAQAFVTLELSTETLIRVEAGKVTPRVDKSPINLAAPIRCEVRSAKHPVGLKRLGLSPNEFQALPNAAGLYVPVASDGSYFNPSLRRPRTGNFTVGEKGCELSFEHFDEALNYLRSMSVAKWRRPNAVGNWGIVSAVRWAALPT